MSGDLGGNPTPWPAPPAPGEQRLRSTTASPMQSPTLNSNAGGGTLQAALQQQQQPLPSSSSSASSPRPAAAAAAAAAPPSAAALSASSQQTILRGSSSSSVAAGANNGNGAAEVTSRLLDSSGERRFLGGVVGLPRERAHHLRVRKRVPLAPGLTAELGLGTELLSGEVTRHAALNYDVSGKWKKEERERQRGGGGGEMKRDKERVKKTRSRTQNEKKKHGKKKKKKKKTFQLNLAGKHLLSLRASPGLLQASRSFTLSLPRSCASASVRLGAGVAGDGRPVFNFDVDNVAPPRLLAAAAAAALASGKALAGAKAVPLFTARVPGVYDSWCGSMEVRASVQRKEAMMTRRASAGGGRAGSSSLDLDGGGGAAAALSAGKGDDIFGPLALDIRELNFVLDV